MELTFFLDLSYGNLRLQLHLQFDLSEKKKKILNIGAKLRDLFKMHLGVKTKIGEFLEKSLENFKKITKFKTNLTKNLEEIIIIRYFWNVFSEQILEEFWIIKTKNLLWKNFRDNVEKNGNFEEHFEKNFELSWVKVWANVNEDFI